MYVSIIIYMYIYKVMNQNKTLERHAKTYFQHHKQKKSTIWVCNHI